MVGGVNVERLPEPLSSLDDKSLFLPLLLLFIIALQMHSGCSAFASVSDAFALLLDFAQRFCAFSRHFSAMATRRLIRLFTDGDVKFSPSWMNNPKSFTTLATMLQSTCNANAMLLNDDVGNVPPCSYIISMMHQKTPMPAMPCAIMTSTNLGSNLAK